MKDKIILAIFFVLTILSAIFIAQVNVNYDLEEYLPSDSEIVNGLEIYQDEFGDTSFANIAYKETDISFSLDLKQELLELDNVDQVVFLDTYLNQITYEIVKQSLSPAEQTMLDSNVSNLLALGYSYPEVFLMILPYLPETESQQLQSIFDNYLTETESFMQVVIGISSSSAEAETVLEEIEEILIETDNEYYMSGNAVSAVYNRNTIEEEVLWITLICVPLILVVLFIFSKSYMDILLFAIVVGVSVVINLGTNAILPNISFITSSMAIVLQLAISLDYVIFLINGYHQELDKGLDGDIAIENAKKKTKKPILASALTTGVSFLALAVMRFTIGFDIGIVFAKAIVISLISTLVLLPVLIRLFKKGIKKSRKKNKFKLKYNFIEKLHKVRYLFIGLLVIVLGFSIYIQTKTSYTYGSASFSASEGTEYYHDYNHIVEEFGSNNTVIIILPKDDLNESYLVQQLSGEEYVLNIKSGIYYKYLGLDQITLDLITSKLYSDNYALVQFELDSDIEGEEAFAYHEAIQTIITDLELEDTYILGETSIAYNIKETVSFDYALVMIVALVAIMIIVFITFKNLLLPVLLPIIIETAVLFTMALLFFINNQLIFIAYIIVSAILLGVTIDYAILLSKSYITTREKFDKLTSIKAGLRDALPSIFTSAMLFSIAGFTIYFISSIESISQIGFIIAIGAMVSLFYVTLVLPIFLSIFDKYIMKGSIKKEK